MKRLRNRVFLQILTPTIIMFLIIVGNSLFFFNRSFKSVLIEKKSIEVKNSASAINDWLSSRISELMLISNSEYFYQNDKKNLQEYLIARHNDLSFLYQQLWYINKNGEFWNTDNQSGIFSEQERLNELLTKERLFLYLAPFKFYDSNSKPVVFFAVPIYKDSIVTGMLGATILLSDLKRTVNYYTYKVFDEIAIVNLVNITDQDSIIIVHNNDKYIGKNESEVYGKIFTARSEFNDNMVFVTVLLNNWKFIGIISNEALFFNLNRVNFWILIFAVITFIFIGVISIGISQLIAEPINSLTNMVKRMMKGDFHQKITMNTNDELQSLANAFNLLNEKIRQFRTNDRFSLLGKISARVAHEIRRPLNMIQIAIQTMNKDNFKENKKHIIQEIFKTDKFIKEILGFSKPSELELVHYSLYDLLRNVADKYNIIALEKGIEINLGTCPDLHQLYFDVLKMEQVFSNIILNSIEAIGSNGVISLSVFNKDDNSIIVRFEDTGPGFSQNVLDKVLDPYFTTKKQGVGLGLFISYQIITAHNAKIEIKNGSLGGALTKLIFSPVVS